MVKRIFSILVFFTIGCSAFSQPYGNEWIDYNQVYYSFQISKDGVYQLDYNTLTSAGIPLSSIDPRNIQIFSREQEIPLLIQGEENGVFEEGEYIEFLAFANDGKLDSLLFDNQDWFSNPHYSMFNDTIHYFLTWNSSTDNKRIRVEEATNYEDYPDVEYVWYESLKNFPEIYWGGSVLVEGLRIPPYTPSEGWYSNTFGFPWGDLSRSDNLISAFAYTAVGAPNGLFKSVTCGRNNPYNSNNPNHHLRISYAADNELENYLYTAYDVKKFVLEINPADLGDISTSFKHEVIADLGTTTDYQTLAWISLRYPHQLRVNDDTDFYFEVPSESLSEKTHLNLGSISDSNISLYTYGSSYTKIAPALVGDQIDALIESDGTNDVKCLLSHNENVLPLSEITKVTASGQFTDFSSMELDSAFVIVTHKSLMENALAYADFRSNSERDAVVVDVDELYMQFGGGIEKHEVSIRRFADLILDTWSSQPAHLFLIGKSLESRLCRNDDEAFAKNLVPSFGWPASDVLITAGLNGTGLDPAIATGRLSATNPQQVNDYRNKAFVFENQEPAEWMKNVMHFGGGQNASDQNLFANYLNGYKTIIQDTCFGASVHTFLKDSTLPIEVALSDSISDLIAEGTSLMTFFGHASGTSFDYSIDDPNNLTWNGHYPLFIGNSCFTGNIHLATSISTSEDFVILPDKGAIGFIASVNLGFASTLNQYSNRLYFEISKYNYGKSIGEQMQKAIQNIQGSNPSDPMINTCLGMTLEGDPSIVVNSHTLPDISISEGDISMYPEELTILVDSIDVSVVLTNIGKATYEPFEVELIRHYPGTIDSVYFQTVDGVRYKDTIVFTIPLDFSNSIGLNTFEVNIDLPANTLAELEDFSNNSMSTSILISHGSILPCYPYEFAIVGDDDISLKASTGDPFIVERNYRFEIDTINSFDSPFMLSQVYTSSGGVIEWDLPFTLTDSTVYFWRVSQDSTATNPYQWNNSSFQYIDNQEGWSQSHFFQFEDNTFNNIIYNDTDREFDFLTGVKQLKCHVYGGGVTIEESSEYRIDANIVEYAGCQLSPALHVAVIDPHSLEAWGTNFGGANPDHQFGQVNQGSSPCRNRLEKFFIFQQHKNQQMDSLVSMLTTKIPDGYYVLIYTWRWVDYDNWDTYAPELYDILDDLGAQNIGSSDNHVPFIFIAEMGNPSNSTEVIGTDSLSFIELYYDLAISGNSGKMRSSTIGPASNWDRLWWDTDAMESADNDSTTISIKAIDELGLEFDLPTTSFDGDQSMEVDLSDYLDSDSYPYLRLESSYIDSITQTPAQTRAWHVNYKPVPEAAINPVLAFVFQGDSINEGAELKLSVAIENISEWDMDSLLVSYWIIDYANQRHEIVYPRQDSLRAGQVFVDTISVSTEGLQGINHLWVEVNPKNETTGVYDQLEQYHFNNIAELSFKVLADNENPILDVSFDGMHILDGELISPSPEILITLDDENPYLLMNEASDTTFFSVFLKDPNGLEKRIHFGESLNYSMIFSPATGLDNISKIVYKPQLELDGEYELLVIAADKSGNASGDLNYRITFEVDHESSVTQVINYPNPFSTSTRFVFTLRGEFVPDYMKIQIMTVTGKIVKTIFKEDLGNVHIGRNISDYAWDGRDDYGDQLANGIYIYHVITKYRGEALKLKESKADNYFNNGFGKMYLMR